MASIHFICRGGEGVRLIERPIYESGNWDVTPEEAAQLIGGMLYLHETKRKHSYFGGRINSYRLVETDAAHGQRIIFTLTATPEAKGAKWLGPDHDRAWTSGVAEDRPKCPKCGSEDVRAIQYGLPPPEVLENMVEESHRRGVVFGGCVVRQDAPTWACASCGHRWGEPALGELPKPE